MGNDEGTDEIQTYQILILFFGTLALLSSASIIVSILVFRKLWSRYYIQLIAYASISDFLATAPFLFGHQKDGSVGCALQALFSNYFSLSSVLWRASMVYQLFDVVMLRKGFIDPKTLTAILCWGLPLFVSVLPLCTDKYGVYAYEIEIDTGYCGIVHRSTSPYWTVDFWNFLFDAVVIVSLVVTIVLLTRIRRRVLSSNLEFLNSYVLLALKKLKYYPLVTVICWTLQVFIDVTYTVLPRDSVVYPEDLEDTSDMIVISQGTLMALVFWLTNEEVRLMWISLVQKYICCKSDLKLMKGLTEYTIQWEESSRAPSRAFSTNPLLVNDHNSTEEDLIDDRDNKFLVSNILTNPQQC
jgi:hypothetical protein